MSNTILDRTKTKFTSNVSCNSYNEYKANSFTKDKFR